MSSVRGILYKLISVAMFIIMSSLIKATSADIPPGEAVFFRSFFALPVIFIWLWLWGDLRSGLRVISPMGHFWRGFAGTAAMGLFFAGLGLLPLPEVTAISYAAPLLTVVFAAMFLGETVRAFRLAAVAIGLVGVIIILSPRLTVMSGPEAEVATALGAIFVFTGAGLSAQVGTNRGNFGNRVLLHHHFDVSVVVIASFWLGCANAVAGSFVDIGRAVGRTGPDFSHLIV